MRTQELERTGAARQRQAPSRVPAQRAPVRAATRSALTAAATTSAPLPRPRGRWRRPVQATASVAAALALLALALPRVTGTSWSSVAETVGLVSAWQLGALTLLWLVGLWAYCFVLAAALPGLRRSQGFVINLVGSGASNLTPCGGAVGVGVTWAMLRQYGFGTASISRFTVVTGVWNVLARLLLPALGLTALLLAGSRVPAPVLTAAGIGAAVSVAMVAAIALALCSERAAFRVAGWVGAAARAAQRLVRRTPSAGWEARALELRAGTAELVRRRRAPLLLGMLAYVVLQGVLQWACLAAVGSTLGWAQVACGYACGRMLTAVVLTPGGTGFAETGAAAVLVALGGDPATTVAGVLLFSLFTYVLEVPGGALAYGWHLATRRWRSPAAVAEPA